MTQYSPCCHVMRVISSRLPFVQQLLTVTNQGKGAALKRSFYLGDLTMLSAIPDIETLSPRVIRVLGLNPGPFTLQGTNTYLIGTGSKRILLDTGEADQPKYISNLQSILAEHNISVQEIILTHWHRDHVGGIPAICKDVIKDSSTVLNKMKRISAEEEPLPGDLKYTYVEDGHVFRTEGATLRALYTPGHTDDHMSLILEEENALFSGDTVLGEGTAVFEDLFDLLKSLERMLSESPSVVYPAHGAVVSDPHAHISYYINHRLQREKQILDALARNRNHSMTPLEIVTHVYKGLADNLIRGAANNVIHHLSKLKKEGQVVSSEEDGETKYRLLQSGL